MNEMQKLAESLLEVIVPALKQAASGGAMGLADHELNEIAQDLATEIAALRAQAQGDSVAADTHEVLLFSSYCGDDHPDECTVTSPCANCLRMSNVFRVPASALTEYVRELYKGGPASANPYAAPPAPSDAATGFCEWLKGYLKPDGHLSAFDVETIRGELAAVQQR